jgi:hypothetical protein
VVSELTFGFWVVLTSPPYAQSLWDKFLHKAFVKKLGRKTIHRRAGAALLPPLYEGSHSEVKYKAQMDAEDGKKRHSE